MTMRACVHPSKYNSSPTLSTLPDWAGIDVYNWGTNPAKPNNAWQSFSQVIKPTYDALARLAPSKPILLGETSASEWGGSKASWITDALVTQLPTKFPRIKALIWFNWNCPATFGPMDWVIESSSSAKASFKSAIASSYYATNSFKDLPRFSRIAPIARTTTSSATPIEMVTNGSFRMWIRVVAMRLGRL